VLGKDTTRHFVFLPSSPYPPWIGGGGVEEKERVRTCGGYANAEGTEGESQRGLGAAHGGGHQDRHVSEPRSPFSDKPIVGDGDEDGAEVGGVAKEILERRKR
jgi:hypothetical protein